MQVPVPESASSVCDVQLSWFHWPGPAKAPQELAELEPDS